MFKIDQALVLNHVLVYFLFSEQELPDLYFLFALEQILVLFKEHFNRVLYHDFVSMIVNVFESTWDVGW